MTKKKEKMIWMGHYVFIGLSIFWLIAVIYGGLSYGWIKLLPNLTPAEMVVQGGALLFPITFFYLLGNYIDRNQMASMEMAAAKAYLEELVYPSEFGSKHVQELNNELKQQIQTVRSSFSEMTNQTNQMREDLNAWIEDLNAIITHMDEQAKNMAVYVQQLESASRTAEEQSTQAGRNLVAQADILLKVTDEAHTRLDETAKQLKTQTEEIAQNVHAVAQAEKSIGITLDKSGEWIGALTENSRKIEKALKTTDSMQGFLADTDKILLRFKELGTTLDMRLKALKNQKSEENRQITTLEGISSAKEFTERMQDILDKLQGLSVEMMPVFEPKEEESLWNQYYAGDKAVFMRYIKGMLTQAKQQKVLDVTLLNPKFQESVTEYMTTFEDLTRGLEHSPWLGVLVGSDPGRLYMMLATVFKGEKHAGKVG